jgi:sugar lactone lactonase YvrE
MHMNTAAQHRSLSQRCALALGLLLVVVATAATASADTITYQYYHAGSYTVQIPSNTTSVQILASGAAGGRGSSTGAANGGQGGKGAAVDATIPLAGSVFHPGDVLGIIVGDYRDGAGHGGAGDEVGANGGTGGGAGIVYDTSSFNFAMASAGGGGGGGGAGGAFFGYDGGAGASATAGSAFNGVGAGAGMADNTLASSCRVTQTADPAIDFIGATATAAAGGTDAGGGGGGGDGVCGGRAGGTGGSGGGGGAGGTFGGSMIASEGTGTITTNPYDVAGVQLSFVRAPIPAQIVSPATFSIGVGAGAFHTTVASQGFPAPTFALSGAPSWVSIDPNTGVMSGSFPPRTAGLFHFDVTATNGAGAASTQAFTLQVLGPPLIITNGTILTGATVGKAYSTALLNTGGIGGETWSVAAGTLPAGLRLSPAGLLTGTPTRAGASTFTVRVTDSQIPAAASTTKAVKLVVAPRVLAITTTALAPATVGQAYNKTLAADLGTKPYRFSVASGALPAGLRLSTAGTLSGTPTTPGTASATFKVTDAAHATATATLALAVVPGVQPAVYVLNTGNSTINAFSPFSGGNVAPLTTLSGPATTLTGLGGVVIDATGKVYVSNIGGVSIAEFPYGTGGNAAPATTIKGADTGLATPYGLTLDEAGRLYVTDPASSSVMVYAAGAGGDAKPLTTLNGEHTGLVSPTAVAIDGDGYLWVANTGANTVTKYDANANGDTQPLATISGLSGPDAIAIDAAGNLLVANSYAGSIAEYSTKASGAAAPLRTIAGTLTGLRFPQGLDIDSSGDIWVSNGWANSVTEYAANASGDVAPLRTIGGALSGLASPGPLAVAPPLSVASAKLPSARRGHNYQATLKANLGTTPYRWAITKGRLPHGLRLTPGGRIAGRAAHLGALRFTVRVTDSTRRHHMTATQRLTLRVRP